MKNLKSIGSYFKTLPASRVWVGLFCCFLSSLVAVASEDVKEDPVVSDVDIDTDTVEVSENTERTVYVIPVQGQIGSPILYIIRRGLKEATANGIDTVVIDMHTPGGALNSTLEIMKVLDRFEGESITFINSEAISAGAFITVATDRIFMHPGGQIGAAEAVSGGGQEIPEAMKRKLQSYINAKVRVYTEKYRYRGDIMRAMTDPNFELEIEGEVFSKEGDLLSLTASEAIQHYGDPPEALLAEGIAESLDEVLVAAYGEGAYKIETFEVTWSEKAAQLMQKIVPLLMGAGVLLLFIEFKTPNFGILGAMGIVLIAVVFLSNYLAGLAGHEVIVVFLVGVIFLAVEFFLLPGTVIFAFLGIALIFGSLIWSLADLWPQTDGFGFVVDWDNLLDAGTSVMGSTFGAIVAFLVLLKVLPVRLIESKLVIADQIADPSRLEMGGAIRPNPEDQLPNVGDRGVVVTPLHPVGKVEINGKYFEATTELGEIGKDRAIQVVGFRSYALLVSEVMDETTTETEDGQ